MPTKPFPALPGYYNFQVLWVEPITTGMSAIMIWFTHGAEWFYQDLLPTNEKLITPLDPRTVMVIWQLAGCFLLWTLISTLLFRAARDALTNDLIAQERVVGAVIGVYAIADVTHILVTFACLPPSLRFNFGEWNSMIHGNVTLVAAFLVIRIAWFLGIGRKAYYYGLSPTRDDVKAS
ncbi:hypothetical protein BDN72DRAFT_873233 [Pluteus cervinus]|uniref:Uncharacterized protein n=1 Tax=Pluteus cervinus TaxID=181527 RepID=A0ACD3BGG1_9AGAR|nr:hypothetical protein BDN72DRAFT_873233 [Pluteus cervinus]